MRAPLKEHYLFIFVNPTFVNPTLSPRSDEMEMVMADLDRANEVSRSED